MVSIIMFIISIMLFSLVIKELYNTMYPVQVQEIIKEETVKPFMKERVVIKECNFGNTEKLRHNKRIFESHGNSKPKRKNKCRFNRAMKEAYLNNMCR